MYTWCGIYYIVGLWDSVPIFFFAWSFSCNPLSYCSILLLPLPLSGSLLKIYLLLMTTSSWCLKLSMALMAEKLKNHHRNNTIIYSRTEMLWDQRCICVTLYIWDETLPKCKSTYGALGYLMRALSSESACGSGVLCFVCCVCRTSLYIM